MRRRNTKPRNKNKPGARSREAKLHAFAAINRVRRGKSKTLSHAARVEHTSVQTIRHLLPAALVQDSPGGRIRVKAGDPYSARVQIITDSGPIDVKARGSRQRELAAHNRADVIATLQGHKPPSTLLKYRGKKVGGQELISDPDRLFTLVEGGELDLLDALYISPETRG